MNLTLVEQITKKQLKSDIPVFKAGDTLKVYVKIKEGNKYRIQLFEGVCIARQGKGSSGSGKRIPHPYSCWSQFRLPGKRHSAEVRQGHSRGPCRKCSQKCCSS